MGGVDLDHGGLGRGYCVVTQLDRDRILDWVELAQSQFVALYLCRQAGALSLGRVVGHVSIERHGRWAGLWGR